MNYIKYNQAGNKMILNYTLWLESIEKQQQ